MQISFIPPDKFTLNNNTREGYEDLSDIQDSIRSKGILQPILARPLADGNFEVVAGRRRVLAAVQLGLGVVPTMVKDWTNDEALEIEIAENLNRRNLSAVEEARALVKLLILRVRGFPEFERGLSRDKPGAAEARLASLIYRMRRAAQNAEDEGQLVSDSEVAGVVVSTFREFGRSWRHFGDVSLALLNYPEDVQQYVQQGGSIRAAREISKVKDPELRRQVMEVAEKRRDTPSSRGEVDNIKQASRQVMAQAQNQRAAGDQMAQMQAHSGAVPKSQDPNDLWHYSVKNPAPDVAYPDLFGPLWGQLPSEDFPLVNSETGESFSGVALWPDPVLAEGEVPIGVYQRLLAAYTVPGERVVSVDSPTSPLIELGTQVGRVVYATCPEVGRPGIVQARPDKLPLEKNAAHLAVVHIPAWNEVVRSELLGWGPETASADMSAIENYDDFLGALGATFDEARRVASTVVMICRDVNRHGVLRPLPAVMQVAFDKHLIATHYFRGWNGLLWAAVVGRGTK